MQPNLKFIGIVVLLILSFIAVSKYTLLLAPVCFTWIGILLLYVRNLQVSIAQQESDEQLHVTQLTNAENETRKLLKNIIHKLDSTSSQLHKTNDTISHIRSKLLRDRRKDGRVSERRSMETRTGGKSEHRAGEGTGKQGRPPEDENTRSQATTR